MKYKLLGIAIVASAFLGSAVFVAAAPSVTITSPNGGETFTVGTTQRITWTSSNVDKVYIGYSSGPGGLDWIATNIPNTGYYDWSVNVGNTINTKFKISITAYQTGVGSANDESDNYFTVNRLPSVKVLSPNGGEQWEVGQIYPITWTGTDFPSGSSIKVELIKGNDIISTIFNQIANDGSEGWIVPNGTALGNDYRIRVSCIISNNLCSGGLSNVDYDISDLPFSIIASSAPPPPPPPAPTMSSLSVDVKINGSDFPSLNYNDTVIVTWNSTGATYCRGWMPALFDYSANTVWPGSQILSTSGSKTLTNLNSPGNYLGNITCVASDGSAKADGITITSKGEPVPVPILKATITSFVASVSNQQTQAISISWQTSAITNGNLSVLCTPGSINFYVKESNSYPSCEKREFANYTNQLHDTLTLLPSGNSSYVSVDFVLDIPGETRKVTITIAPMLPSSTQSTSEPLPPPPLEPLLPSPPAPLPSPPSPLPTTNDQKVQLLLEQIKMLQSQLSQLHSSPSGTLSAPPPSGNILSDTGSAVSSCVELTNNLTYRSRDTLTNGEVSVLQDFLQSKGYLNSEPSGFFGILTLGAVKKFQSNNGISPTGFVGSITRAKIKSLSCQ